MKRRSDQIHTDVLKVVALVFIAASIQVVLAIQLERWLEQPMHAKLAALVILQAVAAIGAAIWYYGPSLHEGD